MDQSIILHRYPQTISDFDQIDDDVDFDPGKHLALTMPDSTLSLTELGYGQEIQGSTPSTIAASTCFRVLSEEGVLALQHVCRQLKAFSSSNPRIECNTRGGVYRSRFLRDLSVSPLVTEHLSKIMQTPLYPHAMGHQLAHLNYAPETVGTNVDKWHYDTLQVDYVMFVTDPKSVKGGKFQYFTGTRDEFAAIKSAGGVVPKERILSPEMPGPGYAIVMQGNYVVHQATALQEAAERITLVNGYSYADMQIPDYTALGQLVHADALGVAASEYSRHVGLRCAQKLAPVVNSMNGDATLESRITTLREVKTELEQAIVQLETCQSEEMRHFGD